MKTLLPTLLLLSVCTFIAPPVADAVCNLPPPVKPPAGMVDPGKRTPTDPGAPPEETPPPPGTEEEGQTPSPPPKDGPPKAPPPPAGPRAPIGPAAGGPGRPGGLGGSSTPRPRGASYADSWRIWWELNREYLIGLRKTLSLFEPASGSEREAVDVRPEIRETLREVAFGTRDEELKATALRALGRVGDDSDAELFLEILESGKHPEDVLQGAAIAIASLSEVNSEAVRDRIRKLYDQLLSGRRLGSDNTRLVCIQALSLRAKDDAALAERLAAACAKDREGSDSSAALLYSLGLARRPNLAAQVLDAAVTGKVGGRKLHDVARSHASLAIAMTGAEGVEPDLAAVLLDRKSREQTRRGTALSIGMMLRDGTISDEMRRGVEKTVLKAFDDDRDPLTRGYLLLAMGQASPPFGLDVLLKTVDKTGDATIKPYAALALGLAARNVEEKHSNRIRRFLAEQLARTRNLELGAALSLACGVAGAEEARPILLERAANLRLNPGLRGPAMEGLGLLRRPDDRLEKMLVEALDEESPEVVQDACIALGFLGRTSAARLLVEKLRTTDSAMVRVHMVVALSHLGGTTTVRPLLSIVKDRRVDESIRASAAAALGILGDPRENDPLFEIDACTSPYGMTAASRDLVKVY